MKKYLFVVFLLNCFSFSSSVFTAELGSGLTDAQESLLSVLPADQRESIVIKMRQAESLETELEETFDEVITVVERPEKKVLYFSGLIWILASSIEISTILS